MKIQIFIQAIGRDPSGILEDKMAENAVEITDGEFQAMKPEHFYHQVKHKIEEIRKFIKDAGRVEVRR